MENKLNINQGIREWVKKPFNFTAVIFTVLAYILLPVINSVMLRWFEEMSLFEPNKLFWDQVTAYPGGILRYLGCYLTQFLYYPWLGASILIAMWITIVYMARRAFRCSGRNVSLLLFAVPLGLLCSVAGMDEGWLTMKSQGYFFSQTLGTLASILLFWAYRSIPNLYLRIPAILIIAFTYYPLGYYSVLAGGMCILWETVSAITLKQWMRLSATAIAIAAFVIMPDYIFSHVPGISVDNDALYIKGLPEFGIGGSYDRWLQLAFAIIALTLFAFALISGSNTADKASKIFKPWLCFGMLAVGTICVVQSAMSINKQVKCAIDMLGYIDYGQWEKVLELMDKTDVEPDFNMMILNNLARNQLGMQLIYGIQRPQFDVESTEMRREGLTTNVFLNIPVNFYLGKSNNSYRWAMEHTVAFGKRVFFLKYMVRAALLNGDIDVARKYNDILHKTAFHKAWARHYQMFIDHPELMASSKEFTSIPDYKPKTIFKL